MAHTPTDKVIKIAMGLPVLSSLVSVVGLLIVVLVLIIRFPGAVPDPVS